MKRHLFHSEPTQAEIDQYGPLFANAISQVEIEKKRSRLASVVIALSLGTTVTALSIKNGDDLSTNSILGYFLAPIVINGIAQLRTERVNRNQVNRLKEVGQIATNESAFLKDELAKANIPIPDILQHDKVQKVFGEKE